jgi:DnaJ family protein A protein 2
MSDKDINYYNTLEVPDTASADEIKKAYRKLSMQYHPDKNGNSSESTEKFQKIAEAYEVLGDAEKKEEYDLTRNNPFIRMMSPQGGPGGHNVSADDLFSTLFGMPFFGGAPGMHMNQGPGPGPGPNHGFGQNIRVFHNGIPVSGQGHNQGQGPINLGQIFGQGFGQGFGHNQMFGQGIGQQQQKPAPITAQLNVPIDKILIGTTIPVDIERWILEGGNKVFEHEMVYVTVPKGIDEGEIIVLQGKGNVINESNKGDIKIFIKIENDTPFKRQGLDLVLEKTISVKDALCGFSFELKYLTGKVYTITNNSGNIINHGYKKVIPGMGFERDGHKGNLLIMFDIIFPEKLSPEIIEALKAVQF